MGNSIERGASEAVFAGEVEATHLSFSDRIGAVRDADRVLNVKSARAALNGQVSSSNEDMSSWDNYDRYFKFGN